MSAHTPGPWTVRPAVDGRYATVVMSTGAEICGCAEEDAVVLTAEDARLIAKAPELLAALKQLVRDGESWAPALALIEEIEGQS